MAVVRAKGSRVGAGRWRGVALMGALTAVGTLAVGVGSASAVPLPPITINGAAPSATGPQVDATLDYDGDSEYLLTISFPASNAVGDEITSVSGQFNQAANPGNSIEEVSEEAGGQDAGPFSFFASEAPCGPAHGGQMSFSCPNFFGGFGPGGQQGYDIDTTLNGQPDPLSSIAITVAECGQSSGDAVPADVCAPPGAARITQSRIDRRAGTATFRYRASHATHYECELVAGRKLKYRARCGSTKRYAHRLPRGRYAFIVWGVNAGGGSAKAAVKRFRIGG